MHEFHDLMPGDFIRNQSATQVLNITQQLDAGVRFVDFRIMYVCVCLDELCNRQSLGVVSRP